MLEPEPKMERKKDTILKVKKYVQDRSPSYLYAVQKLILISHFAVILTGLVVL